MQFDLWFLRSWNQKLLSSLTQSAAVENHLLKKNKEQSVCSNTATFLGLVAMTPFSHCTKLGGPTRCSKPSDGLWTPDVGGRGSGSAFTSAPRPFRCEEPNTTTVDAGSTRGSGHAGATPPPGSPGLVLPTHRNAGLRSYDTITDPVHRQPRGGVGGSELWPADTITKDTGLHRLKRQMDQKPSEEEMGRGPGVGGGGCHKPKAQ